MNQCHSLKELRNKVTDIYLSANGYKVIPKAVGLQWTTLNRWLLYLISLTLYDINLFSDLKHVISFQAAANLALHFYPLASIRF